MSEPRKNPKMFRDSLTVINHPKSLKLSEFFKKVDEKEKEKDNTVKEEYSDRIID